jgi:hypothetical protein
MRQAKKKYIERMPLLALAIDNTLVLMEEPFGDFV